MRMSLEATDDVANFYGMQEILMNKIENPEDKIKKIKNITSKDIQDIAKEVFKDKNLNLALIGPFEKGDEFKDILKF